VTINNNIGSSGLIIFRVLKREKKGGDKSGIEGKESRGIRGRRKNETSELYGPSLAVMRGGTRLREGT